MTCTPSENSDQSGIRPAWSVFAIHLIRVWFLSYSYSAQRRLIRLGGCPGWSESSLCVQVILLVLSCRGSIFLWNRLLINLLNSKVTRYSVLENILWRICLIDGRLKDFSLMAYFDNILFTCITMLWIVSKQNYFANYLPCVLECAAKTLVIETLFFVQK